MSEFRFGGEVNPRPGQASSTTDAEWTDYVYMRPNRRGLQREWWYHRAGCGLWFLAERRTDTNEVLRTWLWQSETAERPEPNARSQTPAESQPT